MPSSPATCWRRRGSPRVLTEEALTLAGLAAFAERLDAEPSWSTLPVVLLVNPEDRRMAGAESGHGFLCNRPGALVLQRPLHKAGFVSAVRTAVVTRRRQYQLRDELAAREEAEARARLLADEMRHRVKNAFAVAASIASQTFRDADRLDAARAAFSGRMIAMARAQDLLASTSHDSAELGELVLHVVEPYRRGDGSRFIIGGPQLDFVRYAAKHRASAIRVRRSGGIFVVSRHVGECWKMSPIHRARRTAPMASVKVRSVLRYQAAA